MLMDGVYGPGTENAVREFQRTFALYPDGVVGPETWEMLYNVFRGIEEIEETVQVPIS